MDPVSCQSPAWSYRDTLITSAMHHLAMLNVCSYAEKKTSVKVLTSWFRRVCVNGTTARRKRVQIILLRTLIDITSSLMSGEVWVKVMFRCFFFFISIITAISSTDWDIRATLYSIINSTTGKYYSVTFIWMVTLLDFIHRLKYLNYLVQHNKQHHRKVLLSSFHLNGHTLGFHPLTQKLEPP